MQRILRFKIDEEELIIGQAPFFFDTIEGLSSSANEINSQTSITTDGYSFKGSKLAARNITITGRIRGNTREEAFIHRRRLISLLNSKRGMGILELVYTDGTKFYIEAFADGGVEITEQNESVVKGNVFTFSIIFTCPNPYWKQEDIYETCFSQINPKLEFELEIDNDNDADMIFGEVLFNHQKVIENKGDCPTGFICNITGNIKDYFILTNLDTGDYLKIDNIDFKLVSGLTIYSLQGNRKIFINYKNGKTENGFKYMDLDSTFFDLRAGANNIKFETHAADVDIQVEIRHENLYVGV